MVFIFLQADISKALLKWRPQGDCADSVVFRK